MDAVDRPRAECRVLYAGHAVLHTDHAEPHFGLLRSGMSR
jgi:hypothetical protein